LNFIFFFFLQAWYARKTKLTRINVKKLIVICKNLSIAICKIKKIYHEHFYNHNIHAKKPIYIGTIFAIAICKIGNVIVNIFIITICKRIIMDEHFLIATWKKKRHH
jgi:hypothetical protein